VLSPALASASQGDAATTPGTVDATPVARPSDTRRRFFAIEANAVVTREMLPTSLLGFDAALAFGNDTFALRAGGALMGAASFRLAANEVSNILGYGLLDACASKNTRQHRVRMCLGGELGGWKHLWQGGGRPDQDQSLHAAGTLKGDYRYRFTRNFGMLFGVGISIPAVGPQFRGRDDVGRATPVLIPGPVTGSLRIGGTFGFG